MLTKTSSLSIQTSQANPQFITRIFTSETGQQFRVVFLVAIVNGELKGRLVSAQPLARTFHTAYETPCLPISCPKNETVTEYVSDYSPIVSPFTELYFFTSQPTRAPSAR